MLWLRDIHEYLGQVAQIRAEKRGALGTALVKRKQLRAAC